MLGAQVVVNLDRRAVRSDSDDRRTVSWSGDIQSPLDLDAALAALRAEASDGRVELEDEPRRRRREHHATRRDGALTSVTTIGMIDDRPRWIRVACTEPAQPLDWETAVEWDLVSDLVAPEIEAMLRGARLDSVVVSHDEWSASVRHAMPTDLPDRLAAAQFEPVRSRSFLLAAWRAGVSATSLVMARRAGVTITAGRTSDGWGLHLERPPTPRPDVCVVSNDDATRLYVDVDESAFVVVGTDGQRHVARDPDALDSTLREIAASYGDLLRVRSALGPRHPRVVVAWQTVRRIGLDLRYCAEERYVDGAAPTSDGRPTSILNDGA